MNANICNNNYTNENCENETYNFVFICVCLWLMTGGNAL